MKPDDLQRRFKTADLTLAQFLVAHNYSPIVTSLDGRLCSFEFTSDPQLEHLTAEYHAGHASVEPHRLVAAEHNLRAEMDRARDGGAS